MLNLIRAANPSKVLLENVNEYQNTLSMLMIRAVLTEWGYDIHETRLDGEDFGAFERRSRFAMVATTKGTDFDIGAVAEHCVDREMQLADFVDPVDHPNHNWRTFSYLKDKEVRDIAAGKGFRRQEIGYDDTSCGTIGRSYQKARSSEPFVRHPDNPELLRLFSPREHATVKTAPQRLVEGLVQTTAHEVLGQGVIFHAFRALGRVIACSITGRDWGARPTGRPVTVQEPLAANDQAPRPAGAQMGFAFLERLGALPSEALFPVSENTSINPIKTRAKKTLRLVCSAVPRAWDCA